MNKLVKIVDKRVRSMSPGQSQSQALSLCDVIHPCKKICGGCQMCVPRSIDPSTTSPIKSRLKSVFGSVLPTSNAITKVTSQSYLLGQILSVPCPLNVGSQDWLAELQKTTVRRWVLGGGGGGARV